MATFVRIASSIHLGFAFDFPEDQSCIVFNNVAV